MSMHALKIRTNKSPRVWTPWGAMPANPPFQPTQSATQHKPREASVERRDWLEKAARRKKARCGTSP